MEWLHEAFISGVDFSLPGNGGPECVKVMSTQRRLMEATGTSILSYLFWRYGYRQFNLSQPTLPPTRFSTYHTSTKRLLLVILCLVFGLEMGFKFATRTVIFVLNPCHVITIMQIIFMMIEPNRISAFWFRLHIHFLCSSFLALAFPVVNTRFHYFEVATYWIQHIMILFIVPPYLIYLGGAFSVEKLKDMSYAAMATGIYIPYNMVFLHFFGMLTEVNLNSMVCYAVSDPFAGPNYKMYGVFYVPTLTMFFGKLMTVLYSLFIPAEVKKID